MINKMSKRISLPKQRLQSCEAASQRDTARWDVSLSLLFCAVLETKMTQTCVNSWEKHPSLCFVKVIKITPRKDPAVGYALNGSVFPGEEGHCQAELDLQPTHIKATLS